MKIVGANNAAAVTSSGPTVLEAFWEENPLGKGGKVSQNDFSGSFRPITKKGGGLSPLPTHNFACSLLSSSPKQSLLPRTMGNHSSNMPTLVSQIQ
jgi:hypothetical protein